MNTPYYKFVRIYMPYCLRRLTDGRYIVLNQKYKPLGWRSPEKIDYDTHPSAAQIEITPAIAKSLSWDASDDLTSIHLYPTDGPTEDPAVMASYLARLALLAELKVESKP